MPNYGDPQYWEERYKSQKGITFDWLEDYDTLKTIIDQLNLDRETSRILNLGCGNSEFCENMHQDGYRNIHNVDISKVVIDQMKERNKKTEMTFEVMDVRDLKYEDNTFDLAVDKSTIDALLCGESSFSNVAIMIKEVQRVLKVGGIYMIISYGVPENRMFHLERENLSFDISIYTIKKDYKIDGDTRNYEKVHYVYICKKKPDADHVSKKFYSKVLSDLRNEERLEEEYLDENKFSDDKDILEPMDEFEEDNQNEFEIKEKCK